MSGPTNELDYRGSQFDIEASNVVLRTLSVMENSAYLPRRERRVRKREGTNVPPRCFPRRNELCIRRPRIALKRPVREPCPISTSAPLATRARSQTHQSRPPAQTSLRASSTRPRAAVSQTARTRDSHMRGYTTRGGRGGRARRGWTTQSGAEERERRGSRGCHMQV